MDDINDLMETVTIKIDKNGYIKIPYILLFKPGDSCYIILAENTIYLYNKEDAKKVFDIIDEIAENNPIPEDGRKFKRLFYAYFVKENTVTKDRKVKIPEFFIRGYPDILVSTVFNKHINLFKNEQDYIDFKKSYQPKI